MVSPRSSTPTLVLPLLLLAGLASCREEKTEEESAPSSVSAALVTTTEVERRAFSDQVEALGTVLALEAIDLSPSVTERVAEIHFDDGDVVKKGTLLVRFEDAEERAALGAAQSTLAEQEREIARLTGLVAEGAAPELNLDEHRTLRDIAEQEVAEAQAQIDDRRVVAPFDGVLGFRRVSVGALVSPGDVIATFDLLDPVKLDFTVPETFLGELEAGLEIDATSDAYPEKDFTGEVVHIDSRVNPVTRSATARAHIPNPDGRLRPGMLMTTVLEKNPSRSLCAPERALISVQSKHFLFVVKRGEPEGAADSGKSGAKPVGTVKRTPVELGRRLPGYVEITSGVEEGDEIVADGLIGLSDGARVEITGKFEEPAPAYDPSES